MTVVDAVGVATGELCNRAKVQKQRLADDSLDHETPIEELFLDQLTCADLLLVSKRDLIDDAGYTAVVEALSPKARPNVKIIPIANGIIDNDILLGLGASAEDDLSTRHSIHEHHHEHGHDHEHDESITTEILEYPTTPNVKTLVKELQNLVQKHEIYRVKGFVNIPDKPMRMILQGVGNRFDYYFDRAWKDEEERKTQLVVIGRDIAGHLN